MRGYGNGSAASLGCDRTARNERSKEAARLVHEKPDRSPRRRNGLGASYAYKETRSQQANAATSLEICLADARKLSTKVRRLAEIGPKYRLNVARQPECPFTPLGTVRASPTIRLLRSVNLPWLSSRRGRFSGRRMWSRASIF